MNLNDLLARLENQEVIDVTFEEWGEMLTTPLTEWEGVRFADPLHLAKTEIVGWLEPETARRDKEVPIRLRGIKQALINLVQNTQHV